jgi:hypothetical protein
MAAGIDTSPGVGASRSLNQYWTTGPGLAKWRSDPHPWTALFNLLRKYMSEAKAKGLTTEYYTRVFGHGPNHGGKHGHD